MDDSKKIGVATRPVAADGREYHIHTRGGEVAERCLLVGDPGRADIIASEIFEDGYLLADHRGLRSFTGRFNGVPMSVVTTGMGSGSAGIVLPEAQHSGGRLFIRIGSCSTLWPEVQVGTTAVCTGAVRLDGASENWAPIQYPAMAHWRVVAALVAAAKKLGLPHVEGIGATTTCFNEGQARPDNRGYLPPRLEALHDELVARDVLFYSMEEATIFTWCSTHGGFPAASVCAIYGNRLIDAWNPSGEREAALIAATAAASLDPSSFPIRTAVTRKRQK